MYLFTSESVTEGHPDKLADQISDAVLDAVLAKDPRGRVACEVLIAREKVVIAGEITTCAQVDYEQVARNLLRKVGYVSAETGIGADSCAVDLNISEQSGEIAAGVDHISSDHVEALGAGDQGIMFGYAQDDTPQCMPLPIMIAHALTRRLAQARHDGTLPWLRPDGKSQVTVRYDDDHSPRAVETVIVACQHDPTIGLERLRELIAEHVVRPALGTWHRPGVHVRINTAGTFEHGGPSTDAGLTGRKIIVDTYGGMARHGGGAFSGKDPTKVDRSGAYAARHIAKQVVAAGLSRRCEIQIGYAIGESHPVSVFLDTFGTAVIDERQIKAAILDLIDLRPQAIIDQFDLMRPIYLQTATYGHMGRLDIDLPWEHLTYVDQLRDLMH